MQKGWNLIVVALIAALAGSTLTAAALSYTKPWQADIIDAQQRPPALTYDTPVTCEWVTDDGEVIGTYTVPLGELNDFGDAVAEEELFRKDVSALIDWLVEDPEMRGHLIRHGMTEERLGIIAARFDGATDVDAYLTFTDEQ